MAKLSVDKQVSQAPQFQDLIDAIKRNAISRQQWDNILCVNKSTLTFADEDRQTILHHAVTYGRAFLIDLLLEYGVRLNCYNKYGETPLFLAVTQDKITVAETLLHAGADPESRNQYGETVLHVASNSKHGILELLLKHGYCYIDARNAQDQTPLHYAVMLERYEAVEALLAYGAKVNIADAKGRTPLHIAASRGLSKIATALLERGAQPDARDSHDKVALHYAVQFDHFELVKQLVSKEAQLNVIDMDGLGDTPLETAIDLSLNDIVIYLLRQGALQKETLQLIAENSYPKQSQQVLRKQYKEIHQQFLEIGKPTREEICDEVELLLGSGRSIDQGESQEFKNLMFKLTLIEQNNFLETLIASHATAIGADEVNS